LRRRDDTRLADLCAGTVDRTTFDLTGDALPDLVFTGDAARRAGRAVDEAAAASTALDGVRAGHQARICVVPDGRSGRRVSERIADSGRGRGSRGSVYTCRVMRPARRRR